MVEIGPRLLVIDDDVRVLRAYARVLGSVFTVEMETDAMGALRRMEDGARFDVILCDRNLGLGMSGQEFFEAMPPDVQARMVMCSGAEPDPDDAFTVALGERFFVKAGDPGQLISLLLRLACVSTRGAA